MANKILVICGPTATGKTALGIKLAKKFKGEIISADSRQVYRGMDIGTGKDIINGKLEKGFWIVDGIPIHLLDIVEPNQEFSVAQYVDLVWKIIDGIWKRKKLPILVGGTGLYIKAVVDGIETLGIEPDWKLRKKLSNYPIIKLSDYLKALDPARWERMNESDRKNPRRLIRAIEVAISNKKLVTQITHLPAGKAGKKDREHKANVLFIGLMASSKVLYQLIDKRIEQMLQVGLESEVKGLLQKGFGWDLTAMSGVGYAEWRPYFGNLVALKQVFERIKFNTHAYARRQMTWFKKDKRINWFDISQQKWENGVEKLCREKLKSPIGQ